MVTDPPLRKALILSKRKKYGKAIHLLEMEAFRYQTSFNYYHTLGAICLRAGDFSGAHTYFNRAKGLKLQDPRNLLGLAVIFLRRGDTDKALDLYLDVQDLDGSNPIVKRALRFIRKYGGTEDLGRRLEQGVIRSLYPPLPKTGVSPRPLPLIAILLVAAALGGVFWGTRRVPPAPRGGLAATALEAEDRKDPVELGGVYRYVLTGDQVLSSYREARELFNRRRDEAAKRELNRILESNASGGVKNKARILKGYTETPGFDSLLDRFSYEEVAADPPLYRDCFVLWKGSATNIKGEDQKITFDLLVGYGAQTRTELKGIVPVEVDSPVEIIPAGLEVLGQVAFSPGGRFFLRAAGIHQAPSLESPGGPPGGPP